MGPLLVGGEPLCDPCDPSTPPATPWEGPFDAPEDAEGATVECWAWGWVAGEGAREGVGMDGGEGCGAAGDAGVGGGVATLEAEEDVVVETEPVLCAWLIPVDGGAALLLLPLELLTGNAPTLTAGRERRHDCSHSKF